MALSQNIGLTSRLLHLLPALAGFCVAIYLAWISVTKELKTSLKNTQANSTTTKPESPSSKERKGVISYAPVWFVAGLAAILMLWFKSLPTYEVVELHNVRVEKKVSHNKWMMSDPVNGSFLYTACGDFPNDKVIWAGYIARKVKYEEHGNCKSIEKPELGFWWLRDSEGNAKEIE